MKKLRKPVAAALIAALLLMLLDHVFMPKYIDENLDGRITREFYTQGKDADIIFLGASTVHYCISPIRLWQETSLTSYDRSNASQTLWQSYYMLKDTLKVCRPQLVALDVSFLKNGEEFIEEPSNRKTIECMRDPVSKLGAVMSSAGDFEQPLSYFLPVLRYHSRWKELTKEDLSRAFDHEKVTWCGYIMDFTVPEEQHIYEPEPIEDAAFAPKAREYLDRIIDLCEAEGIPLLLMKTPTFVNTWHEEYDELLTDLAAARGLAYENFSSASEDMGLDVRVDYIDDGEHTNVVGAHKFTDYLGGYIAGKYALSPGERTEAAERFWSERAVEYEQAVEEGMGIYEESKDKVK